MRDKIVEFLFKVLGPIETNRDLTFFQKVRVLALFAVAKVFGYSDQINKKLQNNVSILYTYAVSWSSEDDKYLATCGEIKDLSYLDADPTKALLGAMKMAKQAVDEFIEDGDLVPEPLSEREAKGEFSVTKGPDFLIAEPRDIALQLGPERGARLMRNAAKDFRQIAMRIDAKAEVVKTFTGDQTRQNAAAD